MSFRTCYLGAQGSCWYCKVSSDFSIFEVLARCSARRFLDELETQEKIRFQYVGFVQKLMQYVVKYTCFEEPVYVAREIDWEMFIVRWCKGELIRLN